jgi:uracil-DNA glycosylase family 4
VGSSEVGSPEQRELVALERDIVACRRCPRLVAWRELVARERKAAFADQTYWGRPVPGFGDPRARILVLGLAPAAHGANRTGRMFTGDRSGDFLYAAMWRAGLASQPSSTARGDGLRLRGVWVTAAVRCAPPANRPAPDEREECLPWGVRELELLSAVRVILCLGAFAWNAALRLSAAAALARASDGAGGTADDAGGADEPRPRPRFGHGAEHLAARHMLIGCYHPSQQNTFTGRLTEPMIDAVLARTRELAKTSRESGPDLGRFAGSGMAARLLDDRAR